MFSYLTHLVLVGLLKGMVALICYFICLYFILFYFILVYFYNTHQVLEELPQGVGGLAIVFTLVYFYIAHQVLIGLPQGVSGIANLFYFILPVY
jgi:hypothetical protein